MDIQGRTVEIKTPTPWNLIGRNMTAPQPMLSPNSILPPSSSHTASISPRKKFGAHVRNILIDLKLGDSNLRKSGSMCIASILF